MNEVHAIAIVVGREPPVGSHLGDRAIVYADGRMEGFVGGSCSRDIIRRQALAAIRSGEPRLVRISSESGVLGDGRDLVTIPMHCISEGAVDVYIEPQLPVPRLILAGLTPVAHALAAIAPALGYEVERFVEDDELCDVDGATIDALSEHVDGMDESLCERSAAVVASQSHYDEKALASILHRDFGYVGLLTSRARGVAVLGALQSEGVSSERLRAVRYPAGLAIGARKPADVAVSILAQIIDVAAARREAINAASQAEAIATDPVCGMDVEIAHAMHFTTFGERTYYFCCAHCEHEFIAEPTRFTGRAVSML